MIQPNLNEPNNNSYGEDHIHPNENASSDNIKAPSEKKVLVNKFVANEPSNHENKENLNKNLISASKKSYTPLLKEMTMKEKEIKELLGKRLENDSSNEESKYKIELTEETKIKADPADKGKFVNWDWEEVTQVYRVEVKFFTRKPPASFISALKQLDKEDLVSKSRQALLKSKSKCEANFSIKLIDNNNLNKLEQDNVNNANNSNNNDLNNASNINSNNTDNNYCNNPFSILLNSSTTNNLELGHNIEANKQNDNNDLENLKTQLGGKQLLVGFSKRPLTVIEGTKENFEEKQYVRKNPPQVLTGGLFSIHNQNNQPISNPFKSNNPIKAQPSSAFEPNVSNNNYNNYNNNNNNFNNVQDNFKNDTMSNNGNTNFQNSSSHQSNLTQAVDNNNNSSLNNHNNTQMNNTNNFNNVNNTNNTNNEYKKLENPFKSIVEANNNNNISSTFQISNPFATVKTETGSYTNPFQMNNLVNVNTTNTTSSHRDSLSGRLVNPFLSSNTITNPTTTTSTSTQSAFTGNPFATVNNQYSGALSNNFLSNNQGFKVTLNTITENFGNDENDEGLEDFNPEEERLDELTGNGSKTKDCLLEFKNEFITVDKKKLEKLIVGTVGDNSPESKNTFDEGILSLEQKSSEGGILKTIVFRNKIGTVLFQGQCFKDTEGMLHQNKNGTYLLVIKGVIDLKCPPNKSKFKVIKFSCSKDEGDEYLSNKLRKFLSN